MAIEHEITTCRDCAGNGMLRGARCATCNGQGLTRAIPEPNAVGEEETVNLKSLRKPELAALAEQRGLDTSGTVTDLIERLMQPDEPVKDEPATVPEPEVVAAT